MLREKLARLIDVKSIVTFGVVGAVIFLGVTGRIEPARMFDLGLMVVGYFFGVKKGKEEVQSQEPQA